MIRNRLKALREQKMESTESPERWTQEAVARDVGVTRQTMISIEKGNYNPSLELAFRIAHLFDLKIEDIFTWEEESDGN